MAKPPRSIIAVRTGTGPAAPGAEDPRHVSAEQFARFEDYVAEMFAAFGMDLDEPGTRDTPQRFVRALYDATDGYDGDPRLRTVFPTESEKGTASLLDQIVEGPIEFYALCEHHGLPFYGHAYVGYVAGEEIIGISKLTRLVRLRARRFTVQERLTNEVADTLAALVRPQGVAVYLEALHLCTRMRGVREPHPKTRTTVWRGVYSDNPELRNEFLEISAHPR